ncbi:MAG: HIT domain-containing protein, partial [Nanoarchaeota archaeon]
MLSEEQIKQIKEQITRQIDSWKATEKQKEQAKQEIRDMPAEKLEEFLIKNKLIKTEKEQEPVDLSVLTKSAGKECIFCLISQGKIQSYKIDENKESVAVLEINPMSRGHVIIVPKKHLSSDKVPSLAFSLAKKTARKLKSKLKAEKVEISTSDVQGHAIINIIPIYKEMPKERKKASEEELKNLHEKLKSGKKGDGVKKDLKIREKEIEKAPVRIP